MNNELAENVINIANIGLNCITVSSPRPTSLDVDTADGGELFRVTRMVDEVLHKIDLLGRIFPPIGGSCRLDEMR